MWHFALLSLKGIEDPGSGIMLLGSDWFEFSKLPELGDTTVKEKKVDPNKTTSRFPY